MTNFEDIPQEKFNKMDKAIEKSVKKDIKNLKINYIDIQNFKNIDGISTELYDWNIIGGFNGNGKSSFVEAILTAIKGQKFLGTSSSNLVKKGENKATINLSIKGKDTEILIERIFKAGTVKKPAGDNKLIATINGEKISQNSLNELLNTLTLDPIRLGTLSTVEQIKEIKKTTGLNTDEIDKLIEDQESDRKESRIFAEQSQTIYNKLIEGGKPKEVKEVEFSNLLKIKEGYQDLKDKDVILQDKLTRFKEKKLEVSNLEKKLEEVKKEFEKLKTEGLKYKEDLTTEKEKFILKNGDEEVNDNLLHNTEEINKRALQYKEYIKCKKDNQDNQDDFDKDQEKLKELRADRTTIISKSNLPEYMEISEDYGVMVDGMEYKMLNTARKIEVGIDLVLISGSPLRMIRIENGGELDIKTIKSIKDKIIDNGFQLFLERPVIDKYDSIIISDGELLDGEEKEDFINNQ